MSERLRSSLIFLICLLAACTSGSSSARPSDDTAQPEEPEATTTTPSERSAATPSSEVPESPIVVPTGEPLRGLLAVVRSNGGLDLVRPDGTLEATLVGSDAGPIAQPTWAPLGDRIAWVAAANDTPDAPPVVTVAQRDGTLDAAIEVPFAPFYLAWSPDGRWIGALGNHRGEVGLAYVDVTSERSSTVVASGQGLYFAWDPDSEGALIHAGDEWGFAAASGGGASFGFLESVFAAPVWVDDPSRAIVPAGARGSFTLTSYGVDTNAPASIDGDATPIATYGGRIWVVGDSTSRRLAVLTTEDDSPVIGGGSSLQVGLRDDGVAERSSVAQGDPPDLEPGLSVLDLGSGSVERVGEPEDLTAGFFWDPTGEHLLRLAVTPPGSDGPLRWDVWTGPAGGDDQSGIRLSLPAFNPTELFGGAYLPFFDQYAQSVSFFSPLGRAFVYSVGEPDEPGAGSIHLVDLADLEPESRRITDGVLAVWSPD